MTEISKHPKFSSKDFVQNYDKVFRKMTIRETGIYLLKRDGEKPIKLHLVKGDILELES